MAKQDFNSDAVVQSIVIESNSIFEKVKVLEITNAETQGIAAELKVDIKGKINTFEDRRKFFTEPLNKILDGINAQAKAFKKPLLDMAVNIDDKLRAYMMEQAAIQRKAQEKERERMAKAMEKDKVFVPKAIPEVVKKVETASGSTISMVDEWKVEITDPWEFIKYAVAEGLRDCITVNEGAVKRMAKPYHGTKLIPSVRCYNQQIPKTRMG